MTSHSTREYNREWYSKNREKRLQHSKRMREDQRADPARAEAKRAYHREWNAKNHARMQELRRIRRKDPKYVAQEYKRNRLTKFGLTAERMREMWAEQGCACAICEEPFMTPWEGCIDHDHETGSVRGLLCNGCNTGLGSFRDSTANLARAIMYLGKG